MALPAPPECALTTPRFAFRHSMIPRPASSKKESSPDDLSPKSVIADRRFISPASSSSSSIDRRNTLSEANHLKCQPECQPRHDRGYSISDGEFSDPDSCLDSTSTSRELGKVGNSGPLESLPETHSLALEATNSNTALAVEMSNAPTTSKPGDGEPNCRLPLSSSFHGLDLSSEPIAISVLSERTSDPERGDKELQPPALQSADEDGRINEHSEWSQTSTSSGSASEQDAKEHSIFSTRRFTESQTGTRRRDRNSRPAFSAELSTSGNPLERVDDMKRRALAQGAASNFGYLGTPLRLFPGWAQAHSGTPPGSNAPALYSASPRMEKGMGSYSPASPADLPMGLRFQHRFHSGPITGSMIPKPPPSKWDDAEKWIVSPGHNDQSGGQPHHRPLQTLTGRRHSIAGAQSLRSSYGAGSPDYSTPAGEKPMSPQFENAFINAGKIEGPTLANSLKKRSKALSFGDLSRRFDPSRVAGKPPAQQQDAMFSEGDGQRAQTISVLSSPDAQINIGVNDEAHNMSAREDRQQAHSPDDKSKMPGSIVNSFFDGAEDSRISKHARSVSMKETSRVPLAVAEPVSFQEPATSCRDMGTQMTPVESLRNSTCTTPGVTMTSPTRHNTPARSGSRRASSLGAIPGAVDSLELQSCHLAKLELRKLAGDCQSALDRNIVWTTREEEEMESAASLREDPEDLGRCQLAAKATKWEEAEQTKTLLRYKNKETEIKDWEDRQKSQAEAEMKRIEAKAAKILAGANERMKAKLALAAKKAAEKRAAAEEVRKEQAAKTAEKAELMRKTGRLSPPRSSFTCCFRA